MSEKLKRNEHHVDPRWERRRCQKRKRRTRRIVVAVELLIIILLGIGIYSFHNYRTVEIIDIKGELLI